MDGVDSVCSTQNSSSGMQLPYGTRKRRRSHALGLATESSAGDETECILITHIRVTNVVARLRRIPVGFCVAVTSRDVFKQTASKPASVCEDAVEWDDEMVLLSGLSSIISLTIFASFGLGPVLGDGEILCKAEATLGELLDRDGLLESITLMETSERNVFCLSSFFEIGIERLAHRPDEFATTRNPAPQSEVVCRIIRLTDKGHCGLNRYRQAEEERNLEESIDHFERAWGLCPPGHPHRDTVLFNLATAKLMRCRVNDVSSDLDMSIDLYRDVLCLRPRDHPDHPITLLNLGIALQARFQRQSAEADEAEGRDILSQVLDMARTDSYAYHAAFLALNSTASPALIQSTGDRRRMEDDPVEEDDDDDEIQRLDAALQWIFVPDPNSLEFFDHLGVLFCIRIDRLDELAGLEKQISVLEVVVKFTSDDHPDKPSWLDHLGVSLLARYERNGDVADLDQSVSVKENAVRLVRDGDVDKIRWLNCLDKSLLTRYERIGDVVDLDKSISAGEEVVTLTPDGDPDKPGWLSNLGHSLLSRYERLKNVADLGKSISTYEEALRLTPDGDANRPERLNSLGRSLLARYECFTDVADLENSILMNEEAARLIGEEHPDKPLHLVDLANSLSARYERSADMADLEKSISVREEVVQLTPDGDSNKPTRLTNLAEALLSRYRRLWNVVDLERSLLMRDTAVRLTPDGHPDKPIQLNSLGNALLTGFERFGDADDLERSIMMFEEAALLTHDGHPAKLSHLNNLGNSLLTRYECFGDTADLEKSISIFGDATRLTPDGDRDKPARLNNLGNALSTRYDCFRDVGDLEKLISMYEGAVQLTLDGDQNKPVYLSNLGNSLSTRYGRFGDVDDLENSISMNREAVRLAPDGHSYKPGWLNDLGCSFLTRFRHSRDVVDLERSVSKHEDAVRLTPDGHPDKPAFLNNLGNSLLARYEHFEQMVDLEKSIAMNGEAVRLTADGHPDKLLWLISLARSLLKRFQRSGDLACSDLPLAISYSSQVARSSTGSSINHFEASQLWIQCVRLLSHDTQPCLLDAYTVAVNLLPRLAWIGLSLRDRHHQLLRAANMACDAAATALEANKPELAIEWLEQGRSVVWSQLSQLRTPIDDLRAVHPELAAQFQRVSHQLEHAVARDRAKANEPVCDSNMEDGLLEKQAERHHALALSRDRLLAYIRALPGFERFLLPRTIAQLSPLAHSGPVVFLNASKYRCDALVIQPSSKHVIHVPLPNTRYDALESMQIRLSRLLGQFEGRVILDDDLEPERGARRSGTNPETVFGTILPYLWDKVVSPILSALAFSEAGPKLPRIFWCPTGPFAFLPIHAAGRYGSTSSGPKLLDVAISSYIPTMSALELPPQDDSEPSGGIRLVAVPQPITDGQRYLGNVDKEMSIIRALASSSPFVDFQEANGSVDDVVAKMSGSDWIHFACHATRDLTNPLDSGFLLAHGRRLKVSDIVALSRPRGGLAFLSACQTATGDEQLSEEAIHVAAGMLLAGYRSVIATMWSIRDSDAPKVAADVYGMLFGDGKVPDSGEAAEALHRAILRLRDSGEPFLSWVPYIHVGS